MQMKDHTAAEGLSRISRISPNPNSASVLLTINVLHESAYLLNRRAQRTRRKPPSRVFHKLCALRDLLLKCLFGCGRRPRWAIRAIRGSCRCGSNVFTCFPSAFIGGYPPGFTFASSRLGVRHTGFVCQNEAANFLLFLAAPM